MMNFLKHKPYQILWSTIPIIIIMAILGIRKSVDIQMHDTYFVIACIHVGIFFSVLMGLIGLIYWIFRDRNLRGWMTNSHIIITMAISFFFIISGVFSKPIFGIDFVLMLLILIVGAQLLFFANLIISKKESE